MNLFDFHPFEAARVGGIVVVTYKGKFVALGTCPGGEGEVTIHDGSYTKHHAARANDQRRRRRHVHGNRGNAARARRRAAKRAEKVDACAV